MPGHWICDRCGYDGEHAEWCVCLRPANEQWMGHRTKEEMKALKRKRVNQQIAGTKEKGPPE